MDMSNVHYRKFDILHLLIYESIHEAKSIMVNPINIPKNEIWVNILNQKLQKNGEL